jgi:hypothetical protein
MATAKKADLLVVKELLETGTRDVCYAVDRLRSRLLEPTVCFKDS